MVFRIARAGAVVPTFFWFSLFWRGGALTSPLGHDWATWSWDPTTASQTKCSRVQMNQPSRIKLFFRIVRGSKLQSANAHWGLYPRQSSHSLNIGWPRSLQPNFTESDRSQQKIGMASATVVSSGLSGQQEQPKQAGKTWLLPQKNAFPRKPVVGNATEK